MQKFVIDPALFQQLSGLTGDTILCDSTGKTLGVYQPVKETKIMNLESPLSEAEIAERGKVKTGKPLEEILVRLGL
jgi:hypothetical protein